MDEVTQQNSALVEENAATAKTLEHQANAMNERVAAFRLNDAGMASSGGHYRPGDGMNAPAVAALPKRAAPTRLVSAGGGAAQVQEF
jgi:methyl-accepting chemotaxis protein